MFSQDRRYALYILPNLCLIMLIKNGVYMTHDINYTISRNFSYIT